jgi:menaquinone-dependent protoporphyrinogen oxidase
VSAPNVLVAYASKHGTTREVAEFVAHTLERRGLTVEVEEAGRVNTVAHYDAVVVGGDLYMGKLHKDARRLLERHREELAGVALAVFGMVPTRSRTRRSSSPGNSSIALSPRRRSSSPSP